MKLKEIISMKKPLGIAAILIMSALAIRAALVYNAYLINQTVTSSQNFVLNLATTPNAVGIARVTAQAVYSSATVPTDTFIDGRVSTATITVASNSGLVSAQAVDQITVAANSSIQEAPATDTLVVNSTNGLTGATVSVAGTTIVNNGWRVDLASHTATDLAAQANTYVNQIVATTVGSTVTFTASKKGTTGNSYTLATSTPAALTPSAGTFSGGQNDAFQNQYITVNGMKYPRGYYWNQPNTGVPLTSTGTAVSLAALLNTISGVQAVASGSVVYATATVAGVSGNSFTLSSSTSALTVATPNFTGGASQATVTINGTVIAVSTGASTTATAAAIASSINSTLGSIVTATNVANVVTTTSTAVGTLVNYTLATSTPTALVPSHSTYVGGLNSAYSIGSPNIFIPSHGYSTGAGLVFSGSSAPSPLVSGTTYFAIAVDANDIDLASSLANAKAGTYITITSSSTSGPHTFTLTPQVTTGSLGLQWAVSNDCTNYTNFTTTSLGVAVSSLTFGSPYTASVTTWDLGPVNYQCLEAIVTGPTTGGVSMKLKLNGSNP
jgi:hypothetical protein